MERAAVYLSDGQTWDSIEGCVVVFHADADEPKDAAMAEVSLSELARRYLEGGRVMGFPVRPRNEAVRMLADAEPHVSGWTSDAVALELSDGTAIYAAADYESERRGVLCGMLATCERLMVG